MEFVILSPLPPKTAKRPIACRYYEKTQNAHGGTAEPERNPLFFAHTPRRRVDRTVETVVF